MDTYIISGSVIVSIVLGAINRLVGGVFAALVTTGILLYGLCVYSQPGYCIAIRSIPLPFPVFLVIVAIWYAFDISQIVAGVREQNLVRRAKDAVSNHATLYEALKQLVLEISFDDETDLRIAECIIERKPYHGTIAWLVRHDINQHDAVSRYARILRVISAHRALVVAVSMHGEDEIKALPQFELPAVRVTATGPWFSKLKVGDLIFSYNGVLISNVLELEAAIDRAQGMSQVVVSLLRPTNGVRNGSLDEGTAMTIRLKRGPLTAQVVNTIEAIDAELLPAGTDEGDRHVAKERQRQPAGAINIVRYSCPFCDMRLKSATKHIGRSSQCPNCDAKLKVPNLSQLS